MKGLDQFSRRKQDYSQRMMGGAPASTCQWIEGETPPFCGKPSVPGFSYCAEHKERCYIGCPTPTRRDMSVPAMDHKRKRAS